MAEVTGLRNNALPYPVYGVPFGIEFPILDADGDLVTGATGLDSERSLNGDTFADCTNEATEIATSSGMYYLLLTAAEMTADVVAVIVKTSSSGAKTTVLTLYPRKLVSLRTGTAQGGAAGYITLDASAGAKDDIWNGCLVVATIDSNVEARIISDYTGSSKQAAVVPSWNVTPDSDDTFIVYLPEGRQINEANVTAMNSVSATATTVPTVAEIADGVWDEDATAHQTQGTFGQAIGDPVADTNSLFKAVVTDAAGATVGVDIVAVKAETVNILADTAEIGAAGAGLTALATAAQVSSLQVNTRTNIQVPIEIEIPDASTQVWKIRMFLFDEDGNMEAPDSTPTIALTNAAGTDRSSRLSSATVLSTGAYSWDYTATAGDAEEQLVWVFTVVEGGLTRLYPATSYVVEETAYRFSSTDRSTLNAAATATALAAVSTKLGTPAGASVSSDIAAAKLLIDSMSLEVGQLSTDWDDGGRLDLLLDSAIAAALLSRQILGNKHTVQADTPSVGLITISVRNDADNATVRTIVYNPVTGARTVS